MKTRLLLLGLLIVASCSNPGGLEAVEGVEGDILFEVPWPDSIKAAVVVVFDTALDLDSLDHPDYSVVNHFITFGDPIDPNSESSHYFIQLQPGGYIIMAIGLLVEPARILADESLFEQIGELIVTPENAAPRGIMIQEKTVNSQSSWNVRF